MIKPCVEASINTLSPNSLLPTRDSQLISSTSIENGPNQKFSQTPVMKFLIKLLHFFTLSCPFSDDGQKSTQQKQTLERDNNKNDVNINLKPLNVLPPFAYTTAMIFFIQLISFIFVLNIEEFSPLVMFSYWRNKIS